jgi:hypothetical protein
MDLHHFDRERTDRLDRIATPGDDKPPGHESSPGQEPDDEPDDEYEPL